MHPCESVAEFVVDVTVRADSEGFADRYADAYDASALRAANDAELTATPACAEPRLERTYQVESIRFVASRWSSTSVWTLYVRITTLRAPCR